LEKLIQGALYWPEALAGEGFDVFEIFNLPIVKAPSGSTVLTIHDIRGSRPELSLLRRTAYALYLRKSLGAVDHVITVSNSMRGAIQNIVPNLPISVIYNGIEAHAFADTAHELLQEARNKYHVPQHFILAVGHLEERKNYLRLLQAIAHLGNRGIAISLVIVGNDSGLRTSIERKAEDLWIRDRVIILGNLSDQDLRCMYQMCSILVFPSVYEGFGIPILEAMAAGCPLALSDIPVFREITQDQCNYFSPTDAQAMADAIETVLTASSEREYLVEYGRKRVRAFDFGGLAEQLIKLYRSLA
jgi:glycosyltransferase involved in cell wall biosynthesis